MNLILLNIWNWLKQKNRWLYALIIAIILTQATIIYLKNKKIANLKAEIKIEIKLRDALLDTVNVYKNKRNELVAEKLTIQATIKSLEKMYGQLSDNQKELINRIEELDKKNSIIAAALISTNVKIDSLLIITGKNGNEVTVDTAKKMVNFNNLVSKDTNFIFDIDVNHVLPAHFDVKPSLLFKKIELPNKQFVEFHWKNDRKKGYPISFSTTNTNKYFQTSNIDSYAIPPLDKLVLNPSGWDKFGNFMIKNGKTILYIGIGTGIGAGAYWLLTK